MIKRHITPSLQAVAGFTLVESFVTLLIAAIFLAIAVPSGRGYILQGQMEKAANDLVTTLNHARSEAIKRNHWVTVCKSTDGSTCNAGANWEDGWLIFSDINSNGALNVGDQLLRVYPQLKAGFTIDEGGDFASWVAFKPTGTVQGSGGNADTYALCYGAEVDTSRAISISYSGSVQLSEPATSCS